MLHSQPLVRSFGERRAATRSVIIAAVAVVLTACADGPTPPARVAAVSFAKAPAGPSVTSVSPPFSHRDTTLAVRVLGSGFAAGAVAEWSLGGVPNTAKIRTNSTQVVSASELIANITVSADADLAFWDVTVFLVGGKKGVGTEKFEVTTATIVGGGSGIGGYVMGTSNQGSVAGYGYLSGAWVFDGASNALVDLGAGQAWGIDPTGTVALGRDGDFAPVVWTRAEGSWSKQTLASTENRGNVTAAVIAADGSLMAGGWIQAEVRRNSYLNRPAIWRRIGGVWGTPEVYAYPGQAASIYDVAVTGAATGRTTAADGTVRGIVWDNASSFTPLDGIAYGINDAGTIVVGEKNGPVFWYRTSGGTWTTAATPLPALGANCTGGRANAVNDAGFVVGGSCVSSSKRQGTVWQLDLSGTTPVVSAPPFRLGGLGVAGTGEDNTAAVAITTAPPYVVVGYITTGNNITVRWPAP